VTPRSSTEIFASWTGQYLPSIHAAPAGQQPAPAAARSPTSSVTSSSACPPPVPKLPYLRLAPFCFLYRRRQLRSGARARTARDSRVRDEFRGRRASSLRTLLARMSAGQREDAPWRSRIWVRRTGCRPWLDGTFWFQTGASTRKGRNVARDPRCSIALSVRDADVVVEGDAARVTEPGALARIAKAWVDQGWPAEPDESGMGITAPFNAPSQGPPPWNVYRIEPRSAIVTLTAEPGGLTRFRF
jgi:Pyridoxamine 5'-phosphate oxidase